MSDQKLFDTVCRTNLSNQLHDLGIVKASVASNHQEAPISTLRNRKKDASDKCFAVVWLLEDRDLLPETRAVQVSDGLFPTVCHTM